MIRIIRGSLKNKKINVPENARPVSERAREACFDILVNVVENASVLDLFAGSGALGFEALSNGAKGCTFIDHDRMGLDMVRKNAEHIGATDKCRFYLANAFDKLADFRRQGVKFDLVFIDPPYGQGIITKLLPIINEYGIVADSGFVVLFCYQKDAFEEEYGRLRLITQRKYGQTRFLVYEKSDLPRDI